MDKKINICIKKFEEKQKNKEKPVMADNETCKYNSATCSEQGLCELVTLSESEFKAKMERMRLILAATRLVVVRPYVALLDRKEPLVLSPEVAAVFWLPFGELADALADRFGVAEIARSHAGDPGQNGSPGDRIPQLTQPGPERFRGQNADQAAFRPAEP